MKAYRPILLCLALLLSAPFAQAQLRTNLLPTEPTPGEGIGYASVTDGQYLVTTTRFSRKAYVFTQTDGAWTHQASLSGINERVKGWASKEFGASLALDNGYLAVGVPGSLIGAEKNVGLIELFAVDAAGEWQLDQVIRAPRPEPGSRFGEALDIEGQTLVVGAPTYQEGAGQAVIYTLEGTKWTATTLETPAPAALEKFGTSVAVAGDWAVVGAPDHAEHRRNTGALYCYQRVDETWTLMQTFKGNREISELGKSVVINGNLMAVGAYEKVMLYTLIGDRWELMTTLKNPDFGEAMSYAGHVSLSPNGQFLTVSSYGKAYVYGEIGHEWKLLTAIGSDETGFGTVNVAGDDFFLLNSPYVGAESIDGAVYVYPLAPWLEGVIR